MRQRRLSSVLVIGAMLLALGASGCSRPAERAALSSDDSAAASASVEASMGASPAASDSASAETSAGRAGAASGPLTSGEADSLERELDAIEKELDSVDMPSDDDFKGIEGSLD